MNDLRVQFLVFCKLAPQGSKVPRLINGHAQMFDANKNLKPFRQAVTLVAMQTLADRNMTMPLAGKHVPVRMLLDFHLPKPPSIPKKRTVPSVAPDIDKLCRAALDALSKVLYCDDGQVTELRARKFYATGPEHVVISMEAV